MKEMALANLIFVVANSGYALNMILALALVGILTEIRAKIRTKYQIPGNCCDDCCAAYWCLPCVLQQMIWQIWANPNRVPGCGCSVEMAGMP
jgi:Cys-rich protein (TIGR01571 family)